VVQAEAEQVLTQLVIMAVQILVVEQVVEIGIGLIHLLQQVVVLVSLSFVCQLFFIQAQQVVHLLLPQVVQIQY
jgi:hypothetical protein